MRVTNSIAAATELLTRLSIVMGLMIAVAPTPAAGSGFMNMLRDINPGPGSSSTDYLTDVAGSLYFVANVLNSSGTFFNVNLWVTSGTDAGTVMLEGSPVMALSPLDLMEFNGTLFFSATDQGGISGRELWRSDGSQASTIMVVDIFPGSGNSSPNNLTGSGGKLFFGAIDSGSNGKELWVSDGLPGGTTMMVKDINPGSGSSIGKISFATDVDGTLFFWADDGTNGYELWKSDGTPGGTMMVKNINATSPGASSAPIDPNPTLIIGSKNHHFYDPVAINGILFFLANDGINGVELWSSDGTTVGTNMVADIHPGAGASSTPAWLTDVNGTLFFTAEEPVGGRELWKSAGFLTGTKRVADIRPGPLSSRDRQGDDMMVAIDGTLFFSATDGTNGGALWKTNGDSAGTMIAADVDPETSDFAGVNKLTDLNGQLFFVTDDGTIGTELWQLDSSAGGAAGTDIRPGPSGSITLITGPRGIDLATSGSRLYVPADGDSAYGDELWVSSLIADPDPTRTRPLGGAPPPAGVGADVSITGIVLPALLPVASGGLFAQIYTVRNRGPALAVNVTFDDFLDFGVAPGTSSPECSFNGAVLLCKLGNLPVGKSVSVFADMTAPIVTVPIFVLNDAIVKSDSVDPKPFNNDWAGGIFVIPPTPPVPGSADLSILKLDTLDPVLAGTSVDYQMSILNNGPTDATGVVVSDTLPAAVVFDSATINPSGVCNEAAGTVTCAIGTLLAGASAQIQIRGSVPTATATFTNAATVSGDQPDPDLANNIATEMTHVTTVPEPGPNALSAAALAILAALARRTQRLR